MTQLEPCPHCRRHVKVSEATCPFCAHPVAAAFANLAPRAAPQVRLGRAAAFAFGVAAMAQGACTDDSRKPPPDAAVHVDAAPDAGPQDAPYDYDGGVPIYSAAPTPDPGTTSRG